MIIVSGIGWITEKKYGCVREGLRRDYDDPGSLHSQLKNESVFPYPVKNFGRFDPVSKITCCVSALALRDAGLSYSQNRKQDIGILGTNESGCLRANLNYFQDYVKAGRTLARGNLFIYTLPSSPLAEAAIYFGLQGPLLYVTTPVKRIPELLRYGRGMIYDGETSVVLAIKADETEAICFILVREDALPTGKICSLDEMVSRAEKSNRVEDIVDGFLV